MGATYVKGRVADITEQPNGDLVLRYEDIENGGRRRRGRVRPRRARGRRPAEPRRRAAVRGRRARRRRVALRRRARGGPQPGPDEHPGRVRRRRGVGRQGHRGLDPPRRCRRRPGRGPPRARRSPCRRSRWCRHERADASPARRRRRRRRRRRIGVYVCHCGGNISDYVDVEDVIDDIKDGGDVVVAKTAMFTCSDATQQEIVADIEAKELDGLVVASCSPKLHTYTFRGVAARAGLNPYEYTQVNIREQCSWVHTDDNEAATDKATALVRAGISRTRHTVPLEPLVVETLPHTLVIGGGIAGLRAAVGLADIGLRVTLVERELRLGGWVRRFGPMYPHERKGRDLIAHLVAEVRGRPVDHGPHRRRGRRQGRQLRQLPGERPGRRRGRRRDRGRRRLDRRRDRLRQLPARRRRVRLRHRRRRHAAGVQGARRRLDRAARLARPARSAASPTSTASAAASTAGVRQRVLLAVLLRGHRPDLGRGRPASTRRSASSTSTATCGPTASSSRSTRSRARPGRSSSSSTTTSRRPSTRAPTAA